MKEVGTLQELGVKAGDVVEYTAIGETQWKPKVFTFAGWKDNIPYSTDQSFGGNTNLRTDSKAKFRIVSRATLTPKLWRDMTPEEKGALLLAAHEGKVIECLCGIVWVEMKPGWKDNVAYRIKPEPKVETIQHGYKINASGKFVTTSSLDHATHKVTIDLIDGKPDCKSVKMECM